MINNEQNLIRIFKVCMQVDICIYTHKIKKVSGREIGREGGRAHLGGHNFDVSDVASQLNH